MAALRATDNHSDPTRCPCADLTLDRISGCDFYCKTPGCGARHHDPCGRNKPLPAGTRDLDVEF
jgi:hypothetical protein